MVEGGISDRQLDDTFQADLDIAQTASTGQAGAYASNAQAAVNRRNRGRAKTAAIRQAARQQALANRNRLIGAQSAEAQQAFNNRLALTNINERRYDKDRNIADRVGSLGRQNTLSSLSNIAGSVGDLYNVTGGFDNINLPGKAPEMDFREEMQQELMNPNAGYSLGNVASLYGGWTGMMSEPEFLQQDPAEVARSNYKPLTSSGNMAQDITDMDSYVQDMFTFKNRFPGYPHFSDKINPFSRGYNQFSNDDSLILY
jgi:hypothetical protein